MHTNQQLFNGVECDVRQQFYVAHKGNFKRCQSRLAATMGGRRGPFKLKVPLPVDDEDSESGSEHEIRHVNVEDSDSSSDGSSEGSEVDIMPSRKSIIISSSSDSSSDEDSDIEKSRALKVKEVDTSSSSDESSSDEDGGVEKKRGFHTKGATSSGSSDEASSESDASALYPGNGESEESESEGEQHNTEKSQQQVKKESPTKLTESGSKKRLERTIISSSSDEDSDGEEKVMKSVKAKNLPKKEADGDDDDTEAEEMDGEPSCSDTDSDNDEGGEKVKKMDEIVDDNDKEWDEELNDEGMMKPGLYFKKRAAEDDERINDLSQAKFVLRNITSHVPLFEETAIGRGIKLSGPPREYATTHLDDYARKFRWPQHIRSLRNRDFSQDPSEILEDHDLQSELRAPGSEPSEEEEPKESPFAQVPRPLMSVAADGLGRSLRKRKRAGGTGDVYTPSAVELLNTARIGGQFGDHFVESLLSANAKALQGTFDSDGRYDKRCWSSLPTKRKPIANWRFVLEHVQRTMGRSERDDSVYPPPMKQETLERITKRLKKLYGYTTQHEENDVFAVATPSDKAPETTSDEETS